MLLTGTPPFKGRRDNEVLESVRRGKFSLSGARWEHVSGDAKDFIRGLLAYHADRRMGVGDALRHAWLASARGAIGHAPLPPSVLPGLRRFAHLRGWKRAVLEAVAFAADVGDTAALRAAFHKCDARGTGHVNLADFTAALGEAGAGEAEAAALFRACAAGGTLAYTDFVAATLPRRVLTRRALREAFDALDVEGRGHLTREGLVRVLGGEFGAEGGGLDDLFGGQGEARDVTFDGFFYAFTLRGAEEGPASPPP